MSVKISSFFSLISILQSFGLSHLFLVLEILSLLRFTSFYLGFCISSICKCWASFYHFSSLTDSHHHLFSFFDHSVMQVLHFFFFFFYPSQLIKCYMHYSMTEFVLIFCTFFKGKEALAFFSLYLFSDHRLFSLFDHSVICFPSFFFWHWLNVTCSIAW